MYSVHELCANSYYYRQPVLHACFCIDFAQRESMVMRRGEDSEFRDKMSKKNKELTECLDEIRVKMGLILLPNVCLFCHSTF